MREEKLQAGKFDVDAGLVQRLVKAQFPQVGRPADPAGDRRRLGQLDVPPRRPAEGAAAERCGYAGQPDKEARWLPRLARHLPVAVPDVVGLGHPGDGFPWAWSIQTWLEGEPAGREGIDDLVQFGWDVADGAQRAAGRGHGWRAAARAT